MSPEIMNKYKLWPDVISKFDFMHGETMYGLEEALDAIYKHQHPVDCKNAKFLISGMFESGFGSEMHVIGVGLATAMNLNRIYIMYPERKYESGTVYMYVYMYIYMYVYMYVCMYVCMYICMYICLYACILQMLYVIYQY